MNKNSLYNKREPRKGLLERREKILQAAIEVFAEKGIEHATIDDIARRAGIGKGTVYRRVGKKEDLLILLFQISAKQIMTAVQASVKGKTDPLLQLKEVINALCDFYERHLDLAVLLVSATAFHRRFKHKAIKKLSGHNDMDIFSLIENILKKAIKKKQIRPVDTHAVTKGLVRFLDPHFYQYLRFESHYTKSEIAEFTIHLFLYGLKM